MARTRSAAAALLVLGLAAGVFLCGPGFVSAPATARAAPEQAQQLLAVGGAALVASLPAPAYAGGMFDFGLTLPFVAFTFILMMVVLNALWYAPVTEEVDERNSKLLQTLSQATDMLSKADAMQVEYTAKIRATRDKASAALAEYRKKTEEVIAGQMEAAEKERDDKAAAMKETLEKEMQVKMQSAEGEIQNRQAAFVKQTLTSISM
ncbi:unnamed protein product [Polarella glacialis]|uniref:ATP synthase subunit b', chloroplastic n=1 Tax=Polarella glacialis TaxID=89957 RepID=A0A813FV63_POLGL|nr:unnamed protein product [Polarella glacialis]CAE8681231.1 unnamed protein product [Polarella glacialis]CAE8739780.1 unnamed protein product [Polarella glacialis]